MSLLPNEWIENSIEVYNYQHTTKSQAIYWVVLAAVTAALISLPFIYIDISVQGSGVIRPVTEKTEIKAAVTELVDSVYVREGQQVNKGDILLRFRTSNPDYKITYHDIAIVGLPSIVCSYRTTQSVFWLLLPCVITKTRLASVVCNQTRFAKITLSIICHNV